MADLTLAMPAKILALIQELEEEAARQRQLMEEGKGEEIEHPMYACGRETAMLLYTLVRYGKGKRILELGTSWGYSTLWLAAAARYTEGTVDTVERDLDKVEIASKYFNKSGLTDIVSVHVGEAVEMADKLPGPWDLVFIDVSKDAYVPCAEKLIPKLKVGGLMVADNMITHRQMAEIQEFKDFLEKNDNVVSQTLPVGNGLEMTIKLCD